MFRHYNVAQETQLLKTWKRKPILSFFSSFSIIPPFWSSLNGSCDLLFTVDGPSMLRTCVGSNSLIMLFLRTILIHLLSRLWNFSGPVYIQVECRAFSSLLMALCSIYMQKVINFHFLSGLFPSPSVCHSDYPHLHFEHSKAFPN